MFSRSLVRLRDGMAWRLRHLPVLRSVDGGIRARYGWLARRVRFPLDILAPYHRTEVHVVRSGGLGDVLMCMPALRAVKMRNSACRVVFHTRFPELVTGLPFIDAVADCEQIPPDAVHLSYEAAIPPRRHIARILADQLGVSVTDVRPTCSIDHSLKEGFAHQWGAARPIIVVNRKAGPWTPNKDWPDSMWVELIERLLRVGVVVEIGAKSEREAPKSGKYIDLRGETSLSELVAILAVADVHVGPISGPVHIAAAVGTRSVVIYGGYEHPSVSNYPENIDLYSPIACSPCWLREECTVGRICLTQIRPLEVEAAVHRILGLSPLPAERTKRCVVE